MLEFRKNNPTRPVDWRWQRAQYLVDSNRRGSRIRDDEQILKARRFIRALHRCEAHEDAHYSLAEAAPDIYEAWCLYNTASTDAGACVRWELEARILAREEVEIISTKLSLPADMIVMYEQLFFNVSDRLDSPVYVTQCVIGTKLHYGLSEKNLSPLWCAFGYWGGPAVLDALLYSFNNPARPDSDESVDAFFGDDIAARLRVKAAIAVRTLPINWETGVELIKLYIHLLELESNRGSAGANESVLTGLDHFMQSLPWHAKDIATHTMDYEQSGVAARADELILMGTVGGTLPAYAMTAKFPDTSGVDTDVEHEASSQVDQTH